MRHLYWSSLLTVTVTIVQAASAQASQIGVAVFNNRIYQAHRGADNQIYTRWSSDGVNWSAWDAKGGETNQAPTLAAAGTRLFLSHRGIDGKIYTRFYDRVSTTWSPWQENGGLTNDAVAMTTFNGRLYQSHRGSDKKIYTRSMDISSLTWSNWTANSWATTSDAPALMAYKGMLYQSFRGEDNKIYTANSSDGINWSLMSVPTQGETSSAPSLATYYGNLYLTQRGLDDKVYTRSFDGQTWSYWMPTPNGIGETPDAPSATGFKSRFYQTIQGKNNGIYTASNRGINLSNATWFDWQGWTEKGGLTPTKGSNTIDTSWTPSWQYGQPPLPQNVMTTIAANFGALLSGNMAGQYVNWNNQCVGLTNWATGNASPYTKSWRRGANVIADGGIPIGTAIATFKGPNNSYDNGGDQHTGIFAGYDTQNGSFGFWIWDQNWGGRPIYKHFIPVNGAGWNNDANLYYAIEY